MCLIDSVDYPATTSAFMKRDTTTLLKEVTQAPAKMSRKFCTSWKSVSCSLKPETNLALMLCLVFYLYICLGGALFLLLEGQGDTTDKPKEEMRKLVVSIRKVKIAIRVLERSSLETINRIVVPVNFALKFQE